MDSYKERRMSLNRFLIFNLLIFLGLTIALAAHNRAKIKSNFISVSGPHAKMSIVSSAPEEFTRTEINESSLITIFNKLAARYPKGAYWCCQGYNVMGSN